MAGSQRTSSFEFCRTGSMRGSIPRGALWLEGDAPATTLLQALLTCIGDQCFAVSANAKPLRHAAAVFSSNFMAVLQAMAREAWQEAGVAESLIPVIHKSLLQGSVKKLKTPR